jgi:cytidylate kinase
MYRAVAYRALRGGLYPEDGPACRALAETMAIRFEESGGVRRVFADDEDVTREIRTPEVTRAVSPVSAHARVRSALVRRQRALAESGGAVLEGRDIGTVVLPGADVKIFLVASTRVRAERRRRELAENGVTSSIESVEADIVRRDQYDAGRAVSPLRRAVGAVTVDTSDLSIEQQVGRIAEITRATAARLAALDPRPRWNAHRRMRLHYRLGVYFLILVLRLVFGLRVHRKSDVDYKENYVFASNHLSYADPPSVGATFPREVHFLAKSALFRNALFGRLIRAYNAIPIRRGVFDRDAMGRALDLLRSGGSLLIFPEGSRARGGRNARPKSGVGYLAVNSGVAVVPVFVSGTDRLLRCFLRRERLYVAHGRPIRLGDEPAGEAGDKDRYREYAAMVMEAIRALEDEFVHG